MKFNLKSVAFSIVSLAAIAPIFAAATPASAQVLDGLSIGRGGMEGSYVGGGFSGGVNNPDSDTTAGGNIQGRFDTERLPVSLRGSVLIGEDSTAIMPLITGDLGIARNTNLYAGAGYSFVEGNGVSPLGDKDGIVLTGGLETAVQRNVVLYGDVKVGLDTFEASKDAALSLQVGAAYRF